MNKSMLRNMIVVITLITAFVGSYVWIVRPWEMRWGATDDEVNMALPQDGRTDDVLSVSTRAVTIHAPAATVWRWLIQTGVGRGGWYSHDWLENLFATGMQNAEEIKPDLQTVKVGDRWLFTGLGNAATVTMVEPERLLSLGGWIFYLRPIDEHTTRLIVRYPLHPDAIGTFAIFEPAHFVMESGMMLGLKERAEKYQ
jgi:hypothetical protein